MGSSWSSDDFPAKEAERFESLVKQLDSNPGKNSVKTEVAWFLLAGHVVDRDQEKAVSLLEERVAQDDPDAMWMLALCKEFGMGTEKDLEAANALVTRAREHKNVVAEFLGTKRGAVNFERRGLYPLALSLIECTLLIWKFCFKQSFGR